MDRTNDDLRDLFVRKMGSELGNLCHELDNELDSLQDRWNIFKELFQKGDERLYILNTVASNFFYIVQQLLYENAMLQLCRLTDPPETFGRENLSIMRLAELISDLTMREYVQDKATQLRKSCEFARDWRNRRLAHTDLSTLRGLASSLPGVTSSQIEEALNSLCSLLQSIEEHFGLPGSVSLADPWGARSLVYYLEQAVRAQEIEKQRWHDLAEEKSAESGDMKLI